ncbi:MBOAT family protein [Flagellimonas sp. S3867]|uniref:MBOAT family O-acyltransferase n=1 Tax=Flagellimonas sp. S3867 TaxID=2768063 RepID=UPI0016866E17|nr:MBOAT family protein [Flagellimonas sp. S3867]
MQFNSIEFLIFCLFFFILWPFFRKKSELRWIFIVVASLIFYAWWDWRFLFLIITSGVIDFFCGIGIQKNVKRKKLFLTISIIANLGLLSIFKYSVFFASILEKVFRTFGLDIDLISNIPEFTLILPIGISFYTFQSLSYTIDIYRNRLNPTKNIFHFFSYLSMFPQLVAGPIVRAKDFLKQLETYRVPNYMEKWNSFKLVVYGLFQKMVIADNLSFFIDSAFEGKSSFDGTLYWWVVMIAFSFQIYCDFSGYSLVARGLAKYMGYHFKMNFNHPYLSRNLKEFWSSWHISLSTWFRDYVYIPLGGSKSGLGKMILALIVTMLLSGLWHGANYTFLIWATIHTILLLIEKLVKLRIKINERISILIVFILVLVAWVYFRAENFAQGNEIVSKLFLFNSFNFDFYDVYFDNLFYLILAVLIEYVFFLRRNSYKIRIYSRKYHVDLITITFCILAIIFLKGEGEQFIYFQF